MCVCVCKGMHIHTSFLKFCLIVLSSVVTQQYTIDSGFFFFSFSFLLISGKEPSADYCIPELNSPTPKLCKHLPGVRHIANDFVNIILF